VLSFLPFGRSTSATGAEGPSPDSLLSIYLPAFILAAGVSIAAPALPLYAKSFQVDFGMASMVVVMNQLGATVATMPTGYLVDRIGGRKVVLIGPILVGVASMLMALAHSFPELLVYRFIEGVGMQFWQLGRLDLITARGGGRRGTQITGMFGMDSAGRLLGPALGGFLAATWGLRAPFAVYAFMACLSIVPSFFLVRDAKKPAAGLATSSATREGISWGSRAVWAEILTVPILMLFAAQFLSFMTRGSLFGGTLDLYAVYAYGIGPQTIGTLALVAGLLGLPLTLMSGRVMDRFGRRATMVPGFTLLSVALFTLATSAFMHWPFGSYVAVFLFARVAGATVSGSMLVLGSDAAPAHARGTYFGVLGLVRQSGLLLSPALFAFLAQSWGFGQGFVLLAVSSFCTAIITEMLLRRPRAQIQAAEAVAAVPVLAQAGKRRAG